jgi:acyl carrier protein
MGLDGVAIVIAVEEAFQIAIPDAEAEKMLTPGDMLNYVVSRVGSDSNSQCMEQRAFNRLRHALMQVLEHPRKAIRPNTPMEELISSKHRRNNWKLIHQATGTAQWPKLTLLGKIPQNVQFVGDLARYLAENARASLKQQPKEGWNRQEIEETIARIIKNQLGITDFRWDQEFVKDLGVK